MIWFVKPSGRCNIYLFVFPDWKCYVGYCTGSPEKRWNNGKGYPGNPELEKAIRNAGGFDKVKKYILVENIPLWLACQFEQYFIRLFDCQFPKGYNKDSGGRKGFTRCQATKDKISKANMGRNGRPVAQLKPEEDVVIRTFPSFTQSVKRTDANMRNVWSCLHHSGRKTADGYRWFYIDELIAAGFDPAAIPAYEEDSPCMT